MEPKRGHSDLSVDDAWGLSVDHVVRDRIKEPDIRDISEFHYELPPPSNPQFRRNVEVALKRVGRKDEDRARWLLRFAAQELAALSEGQRLDLSWEIVCFAIGPPTRAMKPKKAGHGVSVPIAEIHQWLSAGVKTLSKGMQVKDMGNFEIEEPNSWHIDVSLSYHLSWDGHRLVDEPVADMKPRFAAEAYRVLIAAASRFKLCPRCGMAFVARGRQDFCSPRCSQAVRTQRYRAAQNPEKAAQARHDAYRRSLTRRGIRRNAKQRKRANAG